MIDTGIDSTHPDLNVRGGVDCSAGTPVEVIPVDHYGHGTMVAGVIQRRGTTPLASSAPRTAPAIWSVRVISGAGTISEAALLCAADWVVSTRTDQDPQNDIQVANISIGGPGQDQGNCGNGSDALHKMICQGSERESLGRWPPAMRRRTSPTPFRPRMTRCSQPQPWRTTTATRRQGNADLQRRVSSQPDDEFANFSNFAVQPADSAHRCSPRSLHHLHLPGRPVQHRPRHALSSPVVAGSVARCIYSGMCQGDGSSVMKQFLASVEAYNNDNSRFGFIGDPLRPASGQYFGYLTTTKWGD